MSLSIGSDAPEFMLCGPPSKKFPVISNDTEIGKTVVLAFYPGAFSGSSEDGCEYQLCSLNSIIDDLDLEKVSVYGVSSDNPFANQAFAKKLSLKYDLLTDACLKASEKFVGVLEFGKFFSDNGISEALGNFKTGNRGCVIISSEGKIIFSFSGDGNPMKQPSLPAIKACLGI